MMAKLDSVKKQRLVSKKRKFVHASGLAFFVVWLYQTWPVCVVKYLQGVLRFINKDKEESRTDLN